MVNYPEYTRGSSYIRLILRPRYPDYSRAPHHEG